MKPAMTGKAMGKMNAAKMPKPAAAPKPKAPPKAPAKAMGRLRYDDADQKKPNPEGLYNDEGFMDRVPGKQNSFPKKPAKRDDLDAAIRAGFKK